METIDPLVHGLDAHVGTLEDLIGAQMRPTIRQLLQCPVLMVLGRCKSGGPLGGSHALSGPVEHVLGVLLQDTLGDRAHYSINHLPLVEEQQGWDTADAIALRYLRMLIDIELANF